MSLETQQMMQDWGANDMFAFLLDHFSELATMARATQTPNSEDTDAIKSAIVGFYQYTEPENWTFQYWQIVDGWLAGPLFVDVLDGDQHNDQAVMMFAGLALGAMLGLSYINQISDAEFTLGEMQLLMFLFAHREQICKSIPIL